MKPAAATAPHSVASGRTGWIGFAGIALFASLGGCSFDRGKAQVKFVESAPVLTSIRGEEGKTPCIFLVLVYEQTEPERLARRYDVNRDLCVRTLDLNSKQHAVYHDNVPIRSGTGKEYQVGVYGNGLDVSLMLASAVDQSGS